MAYKWILSKDKKYYHAKHNSSIRADLNGNVYGGGFLQDFFGGGGGGATVEIPQFELPGYAQGIQPEILEMLRGLQGAQISQPGQFGTATSALENILGMQPQQFQFPMEEIQQAMQAQQGLQMQDWQKQIRPMLAQQGQLDSSYYTNLMSDMMRGQQAQQYGTTADLLTQQAQQNLALQQFFPQMQAGVAGQLAGIGGQQANLDLQNIMMPYQTTIPGLQQVFQQGMNVGDRDLAQANMAAQVELQKKQAEVAEKAAFNQGIGNLAMGALTGGIGGAMGIGGMAGGMGGFGQGALSGAMGVNPFQTQQMMNVMGSMGQSQFGGGTGQTRFLPFGGGSAGGFSMPGGNLGGGGSSGGFSWGI